MEWAGGEQEASLQLEELDGGFSYMSRQAALREMAGSPAKHQEETKSET